MYNKLWVRDCYAQIKATRRILLSLQDDLGDLAADTRDRESALVRRELDTMSDGIVEIEAQLHKMQERLLELSNVKD